MGEPQLSSGVSSSATATATAGRGAKEQVCPLCMEDLDWDDVAFFPCACGYQLCRFCWHRIKEQGGGDEDSVGRCPACRRPYGDTPHQWTAPTAATANGGSGHHQQQQAKGAPSLALCCPTTTGGGTTAAAAATNGGAAAATGDGVVLSEQQKRDALVGMRVVQRNLVFVVLQRQQQQPVTDQSNGGVLGAVGQAAACASDKEAERLLRRHLAPFGRILKLCLGREGAVGSAYVTYAAGEDALACIRFLKEKGVKASLGTTKYCNHWLRRASCPKRASGDCMYLHEEGEREASFTKQQMKDGKHFDYEKRLFRGANASVGARPAAAVAPPPPAPPAPPTPTAAPPQQQRSPSPDPSGSASSSAESSSASSASSCCSPCPSTTDDLDFDPIGESTRALQQLLLLEAQQQQQHQQQLQQQQHQHFGATGTAGAGGGGGQSWQESLRALLPNVNITFSHHHSAGATPPPPPPGLAHLGGPAPSLAPSLVGPPPGLMLQLANRHHQAAQIWSSSSPSTTASSAAATDQQQQLLGDRK
ncbi:CCR4-NOT transcription complex subunit 4 [Halotydeus destructor]|nr:CCR4-NOT transcription complex subunit 4 [Halotydeus destructor]